MEQNHRDESTSIQSIKETIREFCEERDWGQFHNPKDLAIGIMTEAAELLELFRFKTQVDMDFIMNDPDQRQKVGQELADILYFLIRFSEKYEYDLTRQFYQKMAENEKKYPVDRFKGSNKKYSED